MVFAIVRANMDKTLRSGVGVVEDDLISSWVYNQGVVNEVNVRVHIRSKTKNMAKGQCRRSCHLFSILNEKLGYRNATSGQARRGDRRYCTIFKPALSLGAIVRTLQTKRRLYGPSVAAAEP